MFESNRASQGSGGGVYMNGLSELTCSSCLIQNNTAYSDGGGLYTVSSVVSLENVDIRRNEATCGGGVYSPLDSDLVIVNSLLDSNVASISGGGLYTNASISCKIYDSVFRNNSALSANGGGAYLVSSLTSSNSGRRSAFFSNLSLSLIHI